MKFVLKVTEFHSVVINVADWLTQDAQYDSRSKHFILFSLSLYYQDSKTANISETSGGKIRKAKQV